MNLQRYAHNSANLPFSYNSRNPNSASNPPLFNPPQIPFSINANPNPDFNPYDEQALRDEVIFLHSLWRQGPPSSSASHAKPPQNRYLKTFPARPFKEKNRKSKVGPHSVSDIEWPVNAQPLNISTSGSSWPEFKSDFAPVTRPASADEVASKMAMRAQQKGLDSSCEFFGNDDGEDNDEDGDDPMLDDGYEQCEEFVFFLKMFEEDSELRTYYEKNYENGDFCCFVCAGIRQKLWKKYKNCVALVQHSITILKTKKRRAHRAYGQVICKVLGWDINSLPTLLSAVGDTATRPQENSTVLPTSLKGDDATKDVEDHHQGVSVSGTNQEPTTNDEDSLKEDVAYKDLEGQ
ncbi:hypothetical protein Nepgr_026095 [Nepenthes gracilis]|uniref:Uncharacterized protein n=1 Tax=Nepenthes gracilis TaxID=150966 RepID=A0AAD3Y033_NEPGR|nr:hypothetical protein Nepgr_026095 [Nepenthes gracilis]